jgi:amidase
MVPVADGSDMMGSLRNPAAYNNVIGFRPSYGRVPAGPRPELYIQQLGYSGPMGRTVTDTALLLSTMAGYDDRDPLSLSQDPEIFSLSLSRDFRGARIGWLGDFDGYLPMEDGVLDICRDALSHFEQIGCHVDEVSVDYPMDQLWQTWLTHRHGLLATGLGPLYEDPDKRAMMKPEVIWEIEGGLNLTMADFQSASKARSDWYQTIRRLFEEYDFLVLPSAQVFPFDAETHWPKVVAGKTMDTYHRWMEVVIGGTLSGCPVINVPAGFNGTGLAMGMQVMGPMLADFSVLQIAYAYEQAARWNLDFTPGKITSLTGS